MSLTADFELGTNGATIQTSDPGSGNPWDAANIGPSNSITYDNTHCVSGKQSANFTLGGVNGSCSLGWNLPVPAPVDYYGRDYRFLPAYPGATGTFTAFQFNTDAGACWSIRISTTGVITILSASFGVQYTFTNLIALNQWVRFEYHAVHAAGFAEVKLFNDGTNLVPTEVGNFSGQSIRTEAKSIILGAGSLNYTHWADEIVTNATDYPGPYRLGQSLAVGALGTHRI
jgi:hypothetical protein